jgi:hypothetical protein
MEPTDPPAPSPEPMSAMRTDQVPATGALESTPDIKILALLSGAVA